MAKTGLKPIDEQIRLARIGDSRAFTYLWDTHIEALKAYLYARMGIRDVYTMDDICVKSFYKAFMQIESFDSEKGDFSTWLKSIAHNTALDVIRDLKRARTENVGLLSDSEVFGNAEQVLDNVDSPEEAVIRDEETTRLKESIEALPEIYREPARMFLLEGKPQKEIAKLLGLKDPTVRTRVDRAKKQLKAKGINLDDE